VVSQTVYGLAKKGRWSAAPSRLSHKFADNLKRELPRIPFAPDFKAFADAGKKLAELHLNYEQQKVWPLKFKYAEGVPLNYVVADKMKLNKDKTSLRVNDSLTLEGIPPAIYNYRLGNRSALEWVIDQYRVTEDARSGIKGLKRPPCRFGVFR